MTVRAAPLLAGGWVPAGPPVSFAAAVVALVALARLAEFEGPKGAGRRAVAALLLWPTSVFLLAGDGEALFLAFAIPAWLAARRGRWPLAAVLAAAASCVRITGLFLALALVVEFSTSRPAVRRADRWAERPAWWPADRRAGWLAVPFLPLLLRSLWCRIHDGDWLTWKDAQEAGWGRHPVWPWESLGETWRSAMADGRFAWMFRLEIAGAVVGIGLVLALLHLRRWSELSYVGLQVGALVCSAYYLAIPRSALLWWPLFLLVAGATTPDPPRRTHPRWWAIAVYALVAGTLMVFNTLTFLDGAWAG